jgi:hypothetical protein
MVTVIDAPGVTDTTAATVSDPPPPPPPVIPTVPAPPDAPPPPPPLPSNKTVSTPSGTLNVPLTVKVSDFIFPTAVVNVANDIRHAPYN